MLSSGPMPTLLRVLLCGAHWLVHVLQPLNLHVCCKLGCWIQPPVGKGRCVSHLQEADKIAALASTL